MNKLLKTYANAIEDAAARLSECDSIEHAKKLLASIQSYANRAEAELKRVDSDETTAAINLAERRR